MIASRGQNPVFPLARRRRKIRESTFLGSTKIRGVKRRDRPPSERRAGVRGRRLDVQPSMSATLTPRILVLPERATRRCRVISLASPACSQCASSIVHVGAPSRPAMHCTCARPVSGPSWSSTTKFRFGKKPSIHCHPLVVPRHCPQRTSSIMHAFPLHRAVRYPVAKMPAASATPRPSCFPINELALLGSTKICGVWICADRRSHPPLRPAHSQSAFPCAFRQNRRSASCNRAKIYATGFLAVITESDGASEAHQNNERFSRGRVIRI